MESELEIGIEVSEDMGVFEFVMGIGKVDVGCGLAFEGLGLMEWVGLFGCRAWSNGIVGISVCSSFCLFVDYDWGLLERVPHGSEALVHE